MAKKKKKKGKGRAEAREDDGIPTMVEALKKHRKFKAMAKYSLNALVASIEPGHSGWEDNVSSLVQNGGIEAIRDIIKLHEGDEEILDLCTFALSIIPKHETSGPSYTKLIVEAGAVKVVLNSMKQNPDLKAGIDNAMSLVETCAERNAVAMSEPGHVEAVLDVTRVFSDNVSCVGPCHRTLEKICRTHAGKNQFVAKDGISAVLANMTPERMTDENTLPVMNLLDRLCRDEANIELIKNAGAVDGGIRALLGVLDHSTNEEITNVGARVMNKIAGKYLHEFLAKLQDPSLAAHDRDHYLRIVANLAIDPRNAAQIRSSGVLPAMVASLEQRNVSAIALPSIPITFERCANTDADAAVVIAAGAIEGLVMGLQVYDANSTFVASGVSVISALCTSEAHIAHINSQGGVTQVVRNVANHPEHPDVAIAVCRMIVSCADKGYNAGYFAATGGIPAIVASMQSAAVTPVLASAGAEGLNRMALSHRSYLAQVATSGGIGACISALNNHGEDATVALKNFNLLTTLASEPSYLGQIESEGGITALIAGMYAHSGNTDVQSAGKEAIALLVSEETIRKQCVALQAAMEVFKSAPTEPNAQGVEMVMVGLAAFGAVGGETIIAAGAVSALVDALDWISHQRSLPRKDELIVACFRALNELGQDPTFAKQLHDALESCNGLPTIISAMKANVKVDSAALAGCNLIGSVAKLDGAHAALIDNGAAGAVSSAITKHISDLSILNSGLSSLENLASGDFGATAVFKAGGVRATVKLLNSKCVKKDEYRGVTLKALRLLHRGANASSDARERIQDGGGVEACIQAMQSRPGDDEVADAAIAAATELLSEDDAAEVVADLKELLALPVENLAKRKNLFKLGGVMSKFGLVAASQKFAPVLARHGGVDALVSALQTLHTMPESEARELALNSGINALGLLSRHAEAFQYSAAIPIVLSHLDKSHNAGCLLSVQRLARVPEVASAMLSGAGGASEWKAVQTADGKTYYMNSTTQETSWDPPASSGGGSDVIVTVLEMLQNEGDDPNIALSAYAVLATLCTPTGGGGSLLPRTSSMRMSIGSMKALFDGSGGARHTAASKAACEKVRSLAGLDTTQDWLVYNTGKDECQGAAAHALALLSTVGRAIPQTLDDAVASGTTDTIAGAVFAAKKLSPDLLAAFEGLVETTTNGRQAFATDLVSTGRVGQLVGMFSKSGGEKQGSAMRRNPNAAANFCKLAKKLGTTFSDDDAMKERLNKEGVPQLVMQLMGEHAHSEELSKLGGEALSALLDPRDAALTAIAALEAMLPGLTPADTNETMLRKIGMQNRMIANLITIDGVLDAASMAKVLGVYRELLSKLEALPASKVRDELIADVIGALASMASDAKFTVDEATMAQLLAALDRQATAGNIVGTMEPLAALAKAGHTNALKIIAKHNGISALLAAAAAAESRGDLASAAKLRALAMSIMDCVQLNADSMHSAADLAMLASIYSSLPETMLLQTLPTSSELLLNLCLGAMSGPSAVLAAGWSEVTTADGRTYYANASTGETTWDKPLATGVFSLSPILMAGLQGLAANARSGAVMGGLSHGQLSPMLEMALKMLDFEPKSDMERQQYANALQNLNALVGSVAAEPQGASAIAASGLVQKLLDGLDSTDETKVRECLEMLKSLAGAAASSPELLAAFTAADAGVKLGDFLHANAHNAQLGLLALEVLTALGDAAGPEGLVAMGASGKMMADIDVLMNDHGGVDPRIGTLGARLKQMIGESLGSEAALGAAMQGLIVTNIRKVTGADNKSYFVNADGSTTWEEPAEYSAMMMGFDSVGEVAERNEGAVSRVADEMLSQMVAAMHASADDADMLCAVARALAGLCDNDDNAAALAAMNGIEAIIEALIKNPANVKLLRILVKLLLKFCKHDVFKERVGEARGCYALLLCLSRNCDPDLLGTTGDGITDELEDGWVEAKTEEGRAYYYNAGTSATVWEKPVRAGASASADLWNEMTTADGRKYYYHTVTKETSWTKPADEGASSKQSGLAGRGPANDHDGLIVKVISLLANLTYNSESNCERIMARDGIATLEKAMQTFRYKPSVLEVLFVTFNNICFVSAENKLIIGRRCADEIVAVIGDHATQAKLVIKALKAVGNLTTEDECVTIVIKEGVIKVIVAGMTASPEDHQLQLVSIQVIANLASAGIDLDEDLLEEHPDAHDRTVAHTIFREGGAHAILAVAQKSIDDTNLLLPALAGLEHVCEDVDTAEKLAPHGLIDLVISIMKEHDQDPDIIDPTIELAGTLCECDPCAAELVNKGVLPLLVSLMKELSDDVPHLLVNGAISLACIAGMRQFSAQLVATGCIEALAKFIQENSEGEMDDEQKFIIEALKTMTEVAKDVDFRIHVGEKSLASIIKVCRRKIKDPDILDAAFTAISIISFEKSNVARVVKLGGINVIMMAIAKNSREEDLMVRAIKTIDHIANGDPSYSLLVVKCGGKTMITKIQVRLTYMHSS